MSVLVKGMKMPESCYYCGFTDTSFINCLAFEKPIVLEDDCEERRPDWCPLVALPDKHGRLVDADALLDRIKNPYEQAQVARWVNEQPTVETERKTGKWIDVDDGCISGKCSVCGWAAHMYEDDVEGMDYCPNCGARLEGGVNGF